MAITNFVAQREGFYGGWKNRTGLDLLAAKPTRHGGPFNMPADPGQLPSADFNLPHSTEERDIGNDPDSLNCPVCEEYITPLDDTCPQCGYYFA